MRPPLNAGENERPRLRQGADPQASMRPPLNAGENLNAAVEHVGSVLLQ